MKFDRYNASIIVVVAGYFGRLSTSRRGKALPETRGQPSRPARPARRRLAVKGEPARWAGHGCGQHYAAPVHPDHWTADPVELSGFTQFVTAPNWTNHLDASGDLMLQFYALT